MIHFSTADILAITQSTTPRFHSLIQDNTGESCITNDILLYLDTLPQEDDDERDAVRIRGFILSSSEISSYDNIDVDYLEYRNLHSDDRGGIQTPDDDFAHQAFLLKRALLAKYGHLSIEDTMDGHF